jgi:hypothetical protein
MTNRSNQWMHQQRGWHDVQPVDVSDWLAAHEPRPDDDAATKPLRVPLPPLNPQQQAHMDVYGTVTTGYANQSALTDADWPAVPFDALDGLEAE